MLVVGLPIAGRTQESGHSSFSGVNLRYEFGSPTAMNRAVNVINVFSTQGQGVSWDNAIGIGLQWQSPSLISDRFGLSLAGRFTVGSGQFKSTQFSDSVNHQFTPLDFKIFSYYKTIELSAQLMYSLSDTWYIGAGFWMNYRISNTISQHKEILSSDTALHFSNGTKDQVIAEGDAIATSKFHYGIPVSVGGRFRISRGLLLNPEVFSKIDLEEALRGFSSASMSAGVSLGVLFDLHPAQQAPVQEQQPPEKPAPLLKASVLFTVNGISTQEISSHHIDTLKRRYLALPQTIAPLGGDFSFHRLSSEEARQFALTMLDKASPEFCYKELLNIIGKRLADQPQERLELRIAKKSAPLIKTSADNIREYFISTWGIAPERMEVVPVENPAGDIQFAGSTKVCSPLINEWNEEHLATPEIAIDKVITSELGVRSWRIDVFDGSRLLRTYSDRDSTMSEHSFSDQTIDNSPHTLTATLTASDLNGTMVTASDTIAIVPAPTASTSAAHIQEEYFLSASALGGGWDSLLVERMIRSVTESSTILIRPYSAQGSGRVSAVSSAIVSRFEKAGKTVKRIVVDQHPITSSSTKMTSDLFEIRIE